MKTIVRIAVMLTLVTIQLSHAGNNFGSSFGGSFAGSMLGNALTQPRSSRTEIVQVPVQQQAPAPQRNDDSSTATRRLRKENRELHQEIDELSDELNTLRSENRRLKAENARLTKK